MALFPMKYRPFEAHPSRKDYDSGDKRVGAYPDIKYQTFDYSNQSFILDLSKYGDKLGTNLVPTVLMEGSDFPFVILRPLQAENDFEANIPLTNKVIYLEPLKYKVFPPLVRYFDKWLRRDDAYEFGGESSVAATEIHDYIPMHSAIGIGHPDQALNRYHFRLLEDVDPVQDTSEIVYFPMFVLPVALAHMSEDAQAKRRNVKLTQQTTAVATATLRILSYTNGHDVGHQTTGTRIINLNTNKEHNDWLYEGRYFTFTLNVAGTTGVTMISDETVFDIG